MMKKVVFIMAFLLIFLFTSFLWGCGEEEKGIKMELIMPGGAFPVWSPVLNKVTYTKKWEILMKYCKRG